MDLGWVVVELAFVGFAFDAVAVRAVSFEALLTFPWVDS